MSYQTERLPEDEADYFVQTVVHDGPGGPEVYANAPELLFWLGAAADRYDRRNHAVTATALRVVCRTLRDCIDQNLEPPEGNDG